MGAVGVVPTPEKGFIKIIMYASQWQSSMFYIGANRRVCHIGGQ